MRVTGEELSAGDAIAFVTRPSAGGIGVFVGTTRDSFRGKRVVRLEYEAFVPLARKALERIASAAARRYRLDAVALWHRTGSVGVTEASVVVAASSEHRREALEATAAMIAAVKARAPVWKREWYEGDERCWKENCECGAATPASAAALRTDDEDAWLGPARAAPAAAAAAVGALAGAQERSVAPVP